MRERERERALREARIIVEPLRLRRKRSGG